MQRLTQVHWQRLYKQQFSGVPYRSAEYFLVKQLSVTPKHLVFFASEIAGPLVIKMFLPGRDTPIRFRVEIDIHQTLQGIASVVEYMYPTIDCFGPNLVFRHFPSEPLNIHIFRLNYEEIRGISIQILSGLQAAHARRVMHCNLRPDNILLNTGTNEIKIAGWTNAEIYEPEVEYDTEIQLDFKAPELIMGERKYHYAVDMWSFGVVLSMMLLKKCLFDEREPDRQFLKMAEILGPQKAIDFIRRYKYKTSPLVRSELVPMEMTPLAKHIDEQNNAAVPLQALRLLERMLQIDPEMRITAAEALNDEWLRIP